MLVVGRDRSNGGCHALVRGPQFGDRLAVGSLAVVADALEDRGRRNPLGGVVFLAQLDLPGVAGEQIGVDDPLALEIGVLEFDRPSGSNERNRLSGREAGLLADLRADLFVGVALRKPGDAAPPAPVGADGVAAAQAENVAPMAEERGDDVSRVIARGVGVRAHTMAHGDREGVAFERAATDREGLAPSPSSSERNGRPGVVR